MNIRARLKAALWRVSRDFSGLIGRLDSAYEIYLPSGAIVKKT
jgi:hypothetical protein